VDSTIEVRFKGNRKQYFAWSGDGVADAPPEVGAAVIVEVERGQDLGVVTAIGEIAAKKCQRCGACGGQPVGRNVAAPDDGPSPPSPPSPPPPPPPPLRPSQPAAVAPALTRALRRATPEENAQADQLRREEDDVRRRVRERVMHHALQMKVSDAEWQWDRRKLTVYFTAEQRVDFRALVRDLAARYRTRIELRQIGARDEARRLDGIGRCGRQLCIASWLPEPRPVSLSLAKDQRLALNPAQISGPCGRLLCCLHYEHQFYMESRRRFPKEGKAVRTTRGVERVIGVDIFRDRVTLRLETGGDTGTAGGAGPSDSVRVVPLAQLTRELKSVG
jgi:cell fate regulator YaaT (PSP1 superfamily)